MRNLLWTFLLLTWTASSAVSGAELDAGRLPDDAKWVIHLDLDAVRQAGLVEEVEKHWPPLKLVRGRLQQLKNQIGIDPIRDIAGVTAYDNRYLENSGVVMIDVNNLDAERLMAELKRRQPDYRLATHEGHAIYSWTMHPGRPNQHVVSGAMYGNTVLLSRNLSQLQRAIDQFAGRGQRVPEDSPLAAKSPPGTLILARATGIANHQTPFRSSLLREAQRLAVAVGVDGGEVFVQASMEVAEPQTAVHYRDIVQGFHGLASLQFGDDPRAQRVLNGLTVDVSGRTISAQWRAGADDIIALAKYHLEKRRRADNNDQRPANETNDLFSPPPDNAAKRN